jgi:chromosome segregation ATPase
MKKQAAKQQQIAQDRIEGLSKQYEQTRSELDEQRRVAALFEKDLENQKKAFLELTNTFLLTSTNLAETAASLVKTKASLEATEAEVRKRDSRIAELESQNQMLDKQALDLSTAITNLTTQIADTRRKLATSEGDRATLEKELKRLMAEKAELERQFNDLAVLRAQVAKLKEELTIARRIDWIRRGLFSGSEVKGAQRLMTGVKPPTAPPPPSTKTNYDLNVELKSDGSAPRVLSPTNAPAGTNPPAK